MLKSAPKEWDLRTLTADILASAYDCVIILDTSGQIVEINPATLQLLGGEASDYVGHGISLFVAEIYEKEEDLFELASLDRLIVRGLIKNHRLNFITRDGRRIPVLFSASLLRQGTSNAPRGVLCIAKDLTEMLRMERQADSMRDYADNIIRQVSDMLMVFDAEGKFARGNDNLVRTLGYETDDLKNLTLMDLIQEAHPYHDWPALVVAVRRGDVREVEVHWRAHGGERIPVSMTASILSHDGKLAGIIMTAKDGRESRVLRELRTKQQQLVQSAKLASLGELSGGIAHELNNPLSIITGYTEYIRESIERARPPEPDQLKTYLEKMRVAADKMVRIIQHIRDFSRQSARRRRLINLQEIVERAFSLMRQQLITRGIETVFTWPSHNVMVEGDSMQLEQVVISLFTNARDAIQQKNEEGGRIELRVETVGQLVCLHVLDNGCGIKADHLNRIFDPFFTTKEVGRGTGLGLSVAHGIVAEHGGEIQVQSTLGVGSRFSVTLPARTVS